MALTLQDQQLLLKRCLEGDQAARTMYENISYSNEVNRTIRGFVRPAHGFSEEDIRQLVIACIGLTYEKWSELPQPRFSSSFIPRFLRGEKDLRVQIRKLAIVVVQTAIAEKLTKR